MLATGISGSSTCSSYSARSNQRRLAAVPASDQGLRWRILSIPALASASREDHESRFAAALGRKYRLDEKCAALRSVEAAAAGAPPSHPRSH